MDNVTEITRRILAVMKVLDPVNYAKASLADRAGVAVLVLSVVPELGDVTLRPMFITPTPSDLEQRTREVLAILQK